MSYKVEACIWMAGGLFAAMSNELSTAGQIYYSDYRDGACQQQDQELASSVSSKLCLCICQDMGAWAKGEQIQNSNQHLTPQREIRHGSSHDSHLDYQW